MSTNSPDHSQTDSPLHSFPIEQLDDLISPFLVSPQLVVPPQQRINLAKDYDPGYKASYLKKSKAKGKLKEGIKTPAMTINGKVASKGQVISVEQIKPLLQR